MTEESPFREAALGGPGAWSEEQLRKIPQIKKNICELLKSGLFLSEVCQELGITPNTVRKWRQADKAFDEEYTDAESAVTDTLEKEAVRRARNGVLEPVVSAGKVVLDKDGNPLQIRRYSDSLMQFLLKGRRGEVYGDKREVNAKVGIDVIGSKASLEQKFAAVATVSESDGTGSGSDDSSAS